MKSDTGEAMSDYDWSKFDSDTEATCYCKCRIVYRSHVRIDMSIRRSVSRKPCPGCGKKDNLRKVSFDPEIFTIGEE